MRTDMNGNEKFYKAPKKNARWSNVDKMIVAMKSALDSYSKQVDNIHVYVAKGNKKTGAIPSVSLLPILDCPNCSGCMNECYDLRHDVIYLHCMERRAQNSAIHKADLGRYWDEIADYCTRYNVPAMRLNIGGDMTGLDFIMLADVARKTKRTDFLFFTKNYDGINTYMDSYGSFPENVHALVSPWKGMRMINSYRIPEAHVIDAKGNTTLNSFDTVAYCQGNCTACKMRPKEKSCWTLKPGEKVLFPLH
jgi:hypothetical protein